MINNTDEEDAATWVLDRTKWMGCQLLCQLSQTEVKIPSLKTRSLAVAGYSSWIPKIWASGCLGTAKIGSESRQAQTLIKVVYLTRWPCLSAATPKKKRSSAIKPTLVSFASVQLQVVFLKIGARHLGKEAKTSMMLKTTNLNQKSNSRIQLDCGWILPLR